MRGGDRVGDADRLVDAQAGGKIGGIGGWGQKCGHPVAVRAATSEFTGGPAGAPRLDESSRESMLHRMRPVSIKGAFGRHVLTVEVQGHGIRANSHTAIGRSSWSRS